jgi:antibiotic biosynthesis monooxygenase (ABM) superfamily enzyme
VCAQAHVGLGGSFPFLGASDLSLCLQLKERAIAIIQTGDGVVTQINVFTVQPERQQQLIDLLSEAAVFATSVPGWISASVHRSLDGTRVVNYAQSKDFESAQNIINALRAAGWLDRNKALGEAHPGLYEVVFTKTA